jgi:hypothetical protein
LASRFPLNSWDRYERNKPCGKHIRFGVQPDFQDLEIVGIAQNARILDIRDSNAPVIYASALQLRDFAQGGTDHGRGNCFVGQQARIAELLVLYVQICIAKGESCLTFTRAGDRVRCTSQPGTPITTPYKAASTRGAVVSDLEFWISSRSFLEPLRNYVPKPGRSTRRATWSCYPFAISPR